MRLVLPCLTSLVLGAPRNWAWNGIRLARWLGHWDEGYELYASGEGFRLSGG